MSRYVGARYVTKIYENSLDPSSAEWEAGVNYEPLTLVTYNNGSYLSKKEVPGSVGDPAANPSFWTQTGFYNGQIASLTNQLDALTLIVDDLSDNKESYAPIINGRTTYTNNGHTTNVNFAKIDKSYKPNLVMAGNAIRGIDGWIVDDGGKISAREKATIAINASSLFSSQTACGTTIVDGTLEYTSDIDYGEWGGHDLHNLYMTADGTLSAIDAFTSAADMMALSPVWSFCGDNVIYDNGTPVSTITENTVSPHTIIAQDYDGDYLVMTTGGRRADDYGMAYADVIDCVRNQLGFNARIIYMCDGGGSSTLICHQMRLNRLLESAPRDILTMLVFTKEDVNTYSDFEAGYSQYLDDIENKKVKTDFSVNGNVACEFIGNNATTFRESFYKGTQDPSIDSWSYKEMFRLGYNEGSHTITMLGRDGNDNLYTRMSLDMPNNSAQLLGREVLRGSAIESASAEVTLTSNGVFDASDIIGSTLPIDAIILSAYINSNGYVVLPVNYNNKWVFFVKNTSDMSSAGAVTLTATITYIKSPVTFAP